MKTIYSTSYRLAVAIGLFADLGSWHIGVPFKEPVHMALFVLIIILELLLIYSEFVVASLYVMLKVSTLCVRPHPPSLVMYLLLVGK